MNILKRVCAYYITRRRSILFIITIIIILRSYPLCACVNTRRFDVDGIGTYSATAYVYRYVYALYICPARKNAGLSAPTMGP